MLKIIKNEIKTKLTKLKKKEGIHSNNNFFLLLQYSGHSTCVHRQNGDKQK